MSIKLDHTIVYSKDKNASAKFLAEILGLAAPTRFGVFLAVRLDDDVTLDFADADGEIRKTRRILRPRNSKVISALTSLAF